MLYITAGAYEECRPDKNKIKIVCPSIWIHYVTDGTGYYNGVRLGRGDAFIVHKNDLCEYFPDKNAPWSYVWVRFGGTDDERLLERCGIPESSGIFTFDYAERLIEITGTLIPDMLLMGANTPYKEAVAKMILSLHMKGDITARRRETEWVAKAKEYIGANYHKRLRVEDIAAALHIDRRYLRNLFVRDTGEPTKEYLDRFKMERAAELLTFSEQSVGIIARSVGYEDQLSFSKAFKKHFGASPTEYKSKTKNQQI